jgi:hypothetical protein
MHKSFEGKQNEKMKEIKGIKYPCNGPWRPIGL